jgi:parallel beta-helix repeat protein
LFYIFPCGATNYYVTNSGKNSNDGLSLADAFETLQHAADILAPGDTVLVEDGIYKGFALWSGGTALDPIVFEALGNNALINTPGPTTDGINIENADYVILDGFVVNDQPRNGIRLALANHCVVRNCRCNNNFERGIFTAFTDDIVIEHNICSNSIDEHGIYVSNSSDRPIIRYNECYGNNNIGIHLNGDLSAGGDGIISSPQIYSNYIHDNNLAAGINMDGVANPIIYNNIIINNHYGQGIALFQQDGAVVTSGAKIYNNTIIVPSDGRWGVLMTSGANKNTEIYNNIIINLHAWRGSISCESTDDLLSDYNILSNKMSNGGDGVSITLPQWKAIGPDINSLLADSLKEIFSAPGAYDFHLNSDSQAVGSGNTNLVSTIVLEDFEKNTRPTGSQIDIGAYEFQSLITSARYVLGATEIKLFPNPADSILNVEGDFSDFKLEILNADGQMVQTLTDSLSPINLNIGTLGPGMYFLHIQKVGNNSLAIYSIVKN